MYVTNGMINDIGTRLEDICRACPSYTQQIHDCSDCFTERVEEMLDRTWAKLHENDED